METLPSLIGAPQGKTLVSHFISFCGLLRQQHDWVVLSCDFMGNIWTHRNSHESLHSLNTRVLRCVNVHPVHKQYLLVAENKYVKYFCNMFSRSELMNSMNSLSVRSFCGKCFDLSRRTVKIYDNRSLNSKSKAVSELQGHSLSISSAYFSPSTGNRVLTSCTDDHIRWTQRSEDLVAVIGTFQSQLNVFVLLWQDLRHIWKHRQTSPADIHQVGHPPVSPTLFFCCFHCSETWLLTILVFRHNMHTGCWLSRISAVWDPKQENCFVAGSMLRPRRLQVFHENGQKQHMFIDEENFSTVLPVTAFHPTRNALLGGNSSGRLHVFTDWGLWLLSAERKENDKK